MHIRKAAAACLAAGLVIALSAAESQPSAGEKVRTVEEQGAILDTIAQINHINWVWNTIKTYNNVVVLEEEYDKISSGNLNLNRIPDEETLGRITQMLDTLYSLRKDDRAMKRWRQDFRESRERKQRDFKTKAAKEAKDKLVAQAKECCSLWDWVTNPGGSLLSVANTVYDMGHYAVSLHNDYDNFVYGLDKEASDKEFSFDTAKMDLLHQQNKALLEDQWKLIRRYNLDDRLRVSDNDIRALLSCLRGENHEYIFRRLLPMRERFSRFPEYWYYFSCAAMETGHFKEGLEACDTFFKVNRGIFRDDPMEGTIALNKAFMLPKTDANKPELRRCLELAWKANDLRGDWQISYLSAIMYKGVFDEKDKAEEMLENAIALIDAAIRDRKHYGSKAGVTLEEGLLNCRNALHQLRGEPLEAEEDTKKVVDTTSTMKKPVVKTEKEDLTIEELLSLLSSVTRGAVLLIKTKGLPQRVRLIIPYSRNLVGAKCTFCVSEEIPHIFSPTEYKYTDLPFFTPKVVKSVGGVKFLIYDGSWFHISSPNDRYAISSCTIKTDKGEIRLSLSNNDNIACHLIANHLVENDTESSSVWMHHRLQPGFYK